MIQNYSLKSACEMALNRLKIVLRNEGVTQAALARESGVSEATVNKVYNAKRNPAPATKGKLVKGLNKLATNKYSVDDIFDP